MPCEAPMHMMQQGVATPPIFCKLLTTKEKVRLAALQKP